MRTLHRSRRRFNICDRPYCLWTLRDGSQVLADRHYNPIAERSFAGGIGHVLDGWRWVEGIATEQWVETPLFRLRDTATCRRWSDEILWRFLDGLDMRRVLMLHPVKVWNLNGSATIITGDKIHWVRADKIRREPPEGWPSRWPEGLRCEARCPAPSPAIIGATRNQLTLRQGLTLH